MHTFFVNTSTSKMDYSDILFDICHENMDLVSYNCPMAEWYSPEKGHTALAKRMANDIESHIELTNEFNLVVYIDLCEIDQYAVIDSKKDTRKKTVYVRALRMLYEHLINISIVEDLRRDLRAPIKTLIMFGEHKSEDKSFETDGQDRIREDISKTVMRFAGVPFDEDAISDIANSLDAVSSEERLDLFKKKLEALRNFDEIPGAANAYRDLIDKWYSDIAEYGFSNKSFLNFHNSIEKVNEIEKASSDVYLVSCRCERAVFSENKAAYAIMQLSIACYLACCVYTKTVLDANGRPREFELCEASTVASIFDARKKIYADKCDDINKLSVCYTDLELAPSLRAFANEEFGLDKYGERVYEHKSVSAEGDGKKSNKGKTVYEEREKESTKTLGLSPFDYTFKEDKDYGIDSAVVDYASYKAAGENLSREHKDFLEELKTHTKDVLSNYSAPSTAQHKPLLRKRAVSVGSLSEIDTENDYMYSNSKDNIEEQKVEVVKENAKKAYISIITRYLEFCAARSVALTNVENFHKAFDKKILDIDNSLQRLKKAGLGTLIALVVLYIPFIVIQWREIFENPVTLLTALGSLILPVVILTMVYSVLSAYQKKKFYAEWKKYKKESDDASVYNKIIVGKYDRLLDEVIPALRWIYEYTLDIDFHISCCKLARAKVEHHLNKLSERVVSLDAIIKDLESAPKPISWTEYLSDELDLNAAYCTGPQNVKYYSILSEEILEAIKEKEANNI